MGAFNRKLAQRTLDRSEGTKTKTGVAAHSRERHASMPAPHLAARLKEDRRKSVVSSFLSKHDQDKALAEAMQTTWGKGVVQYFRLDTRSRQRFSEECKITKNTQITVLVASVVDRGAKLYMVYEAKLRSVFVVVEGDGRGGVKPVTVFPGQHYEIRQRQPVISCWGE